MQMFGFGPRHPKLNRRGETIEVCQFGLHIQCRWRLVNATQIVFGSDDLHYPADDAIPWDKFDWDKNPSVLDVVQHEWFAQRMLVPLTVLNVCGDKYGGFQVQLDSDFGRLRHSRVIHVEVRTQSTGDSLVTGTTAHTSSSPLTGC